MTPDQFLITVLLLVLLVLFAVDRFRAETVAIGGLAAAAVLGLVPVSGVFAGLTAPAVVTVIEVLLIVQVLGPTRLFERLGQSLQSRFHRPLPLILALSALGACLSTVMNNVAAFSLMLPAAFSLMARDRIPARWIFLPLSYATLLGGLWTLIGTPPNLMASTLLQQATGQGYAFLDFAPAGIAATIAGFAAMALWLPFSLFSRRGDQRAVAEGGTEAEAGPGRGEQEGGPEDVAPVYRRVMCELAPGPSAEGETAASLEARLRGRLRNVVREGRRLFPLRPDTPVLPGDRLLAEAEPAALDFCLSAGLVVYARAGDDRRLQRAGAVVMPHSVAVGSCVATLHPQIAAGVAILRVEGEPTRFEGPFEELPLRVGNLLLLEGAGPALKAFIGYYDLIEVATVPSPPVSPPGSGGLLPLLVFGFGVTVSALGLLPAEIALGGVVALFCLAGWLDLRLALRNLNWSIIMLLVAMLPLGTALGTTGAAAAIAHALTGAHVIDSGPMAVFALLACAMLITPFVNNTTTLAILAPIALEVARATGLSPQMLLMAVTIGSSLDFLTPFGHHNNMLAFSLGSYRFVDFPRFGWPVSLCSGVAAGIALLLFW
ncbi:SLC13 family permease [Rhizobium straminoryzae]|uniref:SLC13 family permease n=1 Tax=Rhizobium straminoryzae TaxID=1387186 RepID=UPI00163DB503|nr:SLC13 family permease [Rhizobium straminoryzae]